MSEISRIPAGILGFLGIKNGGRYPQRLLDQLAPTWDLAQLYLNSYAEYLTVASTIVGPGYTIFFSAPQNETWYVTDYSLDIASGAGEAWQGCLARATANNLAQVRLSDDWTLGASTWAARVGPRGVILAPGESLGVSTDSVTGVIDIVSQCRFTVLQS